VALAMAQRQFQLPHAVRNVMDNNQYGG